MARVSPYTKTKPRKNTTKIGKFFKKTNSVSAEVIFEHPRCVFGVQTTLERKIFAKIRHFLSQILSKSCGMHVACRTSQIFRA